MAAVRGMYAALRPGGLLLAFERRYDPATWGHLDQGQRAAFAARLPMVMESVGEKVEQAGFTVLDRRLTPGPTLPTGEGSIADAAAEFGVTLHTQNETVFARRP